jgi:hypothetical protein
MAVGPFGEMLFTLQEKRHLSLYESSVFACLLLPTHTPSSHLSCCVPGLSYMHKRELTAKVTSPWYRGRLHEPQPRIYSSHASSKHSIALFANTIRLYALLVERC